VKASWPSIQKNLPSQHRFFSSLRVGLKKLLSNPKLSWVLGTPAEQSNQTKLLKLKNSSFEHLKPFSPRVDFKISNTLCYIKMPMKAKQVVMLGYFSL